MYERLGFSDAQQDDDLPHEFLCELLDECVRLLAQLAAALGKALIALRPAFICDLFEECVQLLPRLLQSWTQLVALRAARKPARLPFLSARFPFAARLLSRDRQGGCAGVLLTASACFLSA